MAPRAKKLVSRVEALVRDKVSGLDALERLVTALEAASKSYRATHWGRKATRMVVVGVPVVEAGQALPALGDLYAITYETEKGKDRKPVLYEHVFKAERPVLLYDPRQKGRLIIAGGTYRVETGGIIG